MDTDELLVSMREALSACKNPRLFETERGFQGHLLVELAKRVYLPNQAIIEQEYQKSLYEHGLTIRPDIIIHEPYAPEHHLSRKNGNITVVELKLRASAKKAAADFCSLSDMLRILDYQVGIFVNIGSTETHIGLLPEEAKGRIVSFAVSLVDGMSNVIEARA